MQQVEDLSKSLNSNHRGTYVFLYCGLYWAAHQLRIVRTKWRVCRTSVIFYIHCILLIYASSTLRTSIPGKHVSKWEVLLLCFFQGAYGLTTTGIFKIFPGRISISYWWLLSGWISWSNATYISIYWTLCRKACISPRAFP